MAKKTQTPPKSFEDALQELEQILADIEGGELGLEESLVKYERGGLTAAAMADPAPAAKDDVETPAE